MKSTEQVVREGLVATASLIPDEKPSAVVTETAQRRPRALLWNGTRAAVVALALGIATMFIAAQIGSSNIPQGPCEVLWDQLAGSTDPEALAAQAGLPTDVYVPADLDGSTMYCTAVTEATIDGPGIITGMAITDSSQTEVWLVLGTTGDPDDWLERLRFHGFENLQRTNYGFTNAEHRLPEVNFWIKAAEYQTGPGNTP